MSPRSRSTAIELGMMKRSPRSTLTASRWQPLATKVSYFLVAQVLSGARPGSSGGGALSEKIIAINTLGHDLEKWKPVSRLREARFGGRSKVG
jgi:hypothetical protein